MAHLSSSGELSSDDSDHLPIKPPSTRPASAVTTVKLNITQSDRHRKKHRRERSRSPNRKSGNSSHRSSTVQKQRDKLPDVKSQAREEDLRKRLEEKVRQKKHITKKLEQEQFEKTKLLKPSQHHHATLSQSSSGDELESTVQKSSKSPQITSPPVKEKKRKPVYLPAIYGCRSVEEFNCLNRIEEGTYGVVYRAKDKKTDEIVALKRLKMEKEKEGFPITSLREINTLLKAQHENIVTVREIVVGSNMDKIYIVMDFVEHDLKSLMENMSHPFRLPEVKCLMRQLLRAVAHLHDNWILHRDLKTSNLLLSHKGILKVGDFGLAREYGSPLLRYTPIVVTLWYRSVELLLGSKIYSTPIDVWSVGCIFGELLLMKPLFPGKGEIDELNLVFRDLGTPSDKIWPGYSELPLVKKLTLPDYKYNTLKKRFGSNLTETGFDFINRLLTYNPSKRITADQALSHEFFVEKPTACDPSMFPTWPAKSEGGKKTIVSPKPPTGGDAYAKLMEGDVVETEDSLESGSGFRLTAKKSLTKGFSGQIVPGGSKSGFSLKF